MNRKTKKTNGMDKETEQKEPFGLSGRFPPLSFLGIQNGSKKCKWDSGGCLKGPICLPSLFYFQKIVFFVSHTCVGGIRA
jgi:hypothetical protein